MQGIELGATRLSVDQTLYVPAYNDKARTQRDIYETPIDHSPFTSHDTTTGAVRQRREQAHGRLLRLARRPPAARPARHARPRTFYLENGGSIDLSLTRQHMHTIQYGTRYAVQLSNFPPGSQVSLRLVRKQVRTCVRVRMYRLQLFAPLVCLSVDPDPPHTIYNHRAPGRPPSSRGCSTRPCRWTRWARRWPSTPSSRRRSCRCGRSSSSPRATTTSRRVG